MLQNMANRLGELIRKRREELGISHAELARQAGMAPAYLSQVESGQRKWPQKYIDKLADVLGLTPVEMAVAAEKISKVPVGRDRDLAELVKDSPGEMIPLFRAFFDSAKITSEGDEYLIEIPDLHEKNFEWFIPLMVNVIRSRQEAKEPRIALEADMISLAADYFTALTIAARDPENRANAAFAGYLKETGLSMLDTIAALQDLETERARFSDLDRLPIGQIRSATTRNLYDRNRKD